MNEQNKDEKSKTPPEQSGFEPQMEQNFDPDQDSIELGLRFLVGLLALGGEQATRRLQDMQRKLNQDPSFWNTEQPAGNKTLRRQAWHFSVGLIGRGQRLLRKNIRRGFELTMGAVDRTGQASRLPDPVRDALEARLVQWRVEASKIIKEG